MTVLILAEYTESAHETLRRAVDECTAKLKLKSGDAQTCVKIAHKAWEGGSSKAAAISAARRYAYKVHQLETGPEVA
jgi:hypothetical protein